MKLRTFNEWSRKGYTIKKGSKGIRTSHGLVLFTENQVRSYEPKGSFSRDESRSSSNYEWCPSMDDYVDYY